MYQFFVEPSQIQGTRVIITGNDVNHIKNVLRTQPGEEIAVSNGEEPGCSAVLAGASSSADSAAVCHRGWQMLGRLALQAAQYL